MTVCPWCGQQSQSDVNCDWCKRPMNDRRYGPPSAAANRNDLDFLKDESEVDRYTILRWGAVVACAIACGAALFFVLRGSSAPEAVANAQEDGGPPKPAADAPQPSAHLVSAPAFQVHNSDWWIQQWNSGKDIISNAGAEWTKAQPNPQDKAVVATNVNNNGPVRLQNVVMTMVALPNGQKRVVGRADVVNYSDRNVLDYRAELIWGANDIGMIALQGNDKGFHQVYERVLKPGKKMAVQLVSLKVKDHA